MKNVRWSLSAAALCALALSAYGCSSDPAASDDDDDDTTSSSSSGKAASSSGGKASSSSGGKSSSSGGKSSSSSSSGESSSGESSSGESSSSGGSTSSSSGEAPGDAGTETLPDASAGDGGVSDAGVALTCPGNLGPVGYWGYASTGPNGACTTAQIAGWATACTGAGTEATCDAFIAANGTCNDCISGTGSKLGAIVPVRIGTEFNIIPNTNGCVAVLNNVDDDCFSYATNVPVCQYENCASCSAGNRTACFTSSFNDDTNGCGQLVDAVDACLTTATQQDYDDCGDSDETFLAAYTKVATLLCGPAN